MLGESFQPERHCASTLACLKSLGVNVERNDTSVSDSRPCLSALLRHFLGLRKFWFDNQDVECILAGQKFTSELRGDESLCRPMARIITPLEMMEAKITSQRRPPSASRHRGNLKAVGYSLPVASAQVKSCLMFAGLFAEGETSVTEPIHTRHHGEIALRAFGANVTQSEPIAVRGRQPLRAIEGQSLATSPELVFPVRDCLFFPGSENA